MQRIVYNGHKRVHGLKFQSVALPNGLIANMYGPVGEYLVLIRFIIKEKLSESYYMSRRLIFDGNVYKKI